MTREANNRLLIEAFADAFEDILREVNRSQSSGTTGVDGLLRFTNMLNQGASATVKDLTDAALARIDPYRGTEQIRERARSTIEVARSGLAFLLELKARDGAARARLSRRETELRVSIRDYVEEREARTRALRAEWSASAKAGIGKPVTRKAARKRRKTSSKTL